MTYFYSNLFIWLCCVACGILVNWSGIDRTCVTLQGKRRFPTTGLPGNSLCNFFQYCMWLEFTPRRLISFNYFAQNTITVKYEKKTVRTMVCSHMPRIRQYQKKSSSSMETRANTDSLNPSSTCPSSDFWYVILSMSVLANHLAK